MSESGGLRARTSVLLIALSIGAGGACAKKPDEVATTQLKAGAGTTNEPAPSPAALTTAPAEATAIADATMGLFERLAKERASRPNGTPRADAVISGLKKAGIDVNEENQVYAATVKASYCEATKGKNVYLSICEYADEPLAAAGRDYSMKTFAMVPNRQIFVNKKTTLTVAQATHTPEGDIEAKAVGELFAKM